MDQWLQDPTVQALKDYQETLWINPKLKSMASIQDHLQLTLEDVKEAQARLARFAPYIQSVFPETQSTQGIIESPLRPLPRMKKDLEDRYQVTLPGDLLLKCDSHLAISGSIKARGGIYEVLKHGEHLALEAGLLSLTDDYSKLDHPEFRDFFGQYAIAVGSTGNLGLSIGIISAKMGFKVFVHMSADAKQWKKDMLRSKGVTVVEYQDDYSKAVEEGRRQAEADPNMHFIDDENSTDLFMGYAVAGLRLEAQLRDAGKRVDQDHPLYVHLPCGVGGGPGGVAFGLKLVFGDHVHCFFAEPTHSPCMILGMASGLHDDIAVGDIGLDNVTAADGLAVGRPSGFVGRFMEPMMDGCYTLSDEEMYRLLTRLHQTEDLQLEPSALAGMKGPVLLAGDPVQGKTLPQGAIHLAWATGGSMVPSEEMKGFIAKGASLL